MPIQPTLPAADDLRLLQDYVSTGDAEAIRTLAQRHRPMVFGTCRRYLRCEADAEDATQEVFLALMAHAPSVRTNVGAWLHRCALNTAASLLRSRRSRMNRELERARIAGNATENGDTTWSEWSTRLEECLAELDAADHGLIYQNCVAGVTQKEIAFSLGITQQAVAKRIGKVMSRVRRALLSRHGTTGAVALAILMLKRAAKAAAKWTLGASAAPTGGTATGAGAVATLKVGITVTVLATAAVMTYESVAEKPAPLPATLPDIALPLAVETPHRTSVNFAALLMKNLNTAALLAPRTSQKPLFAIKRTTEHLTTPQQTLTLAKADPSAAPAFLNNPPTAVLRISLPPLKSTSNDAPALQLQTFSFTPHTRSGGTSITLLPAKSLPAASDVAVIAPLPEPAPELAPLASPMPLASAPILSPDTLMNLPTDTLRNQIGQTSAANVQPLPQPLGGFTSANGSLPTHNRNPQPVLQLPGTSNSGMPTSGSGAGPANGGIGGPGAHSSGNWILRAIRGDADPLPPSSSIRGSISQIISSSTALSINSLNAATFGTSVSLADGIDGTLLINGASIASSTHRSLLSFATNSSADLSGEQSFDQTDLDDSNTLTMDIGGHLRGTQYDQLNASNHLRLGGKLQIQFINNFTPNPGDSFDLFDGNLTGTFNQLDLPTLPSNLQWNTANLYTTGTLAVSPIPEPTSLALLAAGASLLIARRKK